MFFDYKVLPPVSQSTINYLVLQIKTKYRPAGEVLLHSPLLKPDNLRRVINQVIEELNPTGNIQVSSMLLDLGTLSLAQFDTQFNLRLAQALADNLRRLSEEPPPQPGPALAAEPAALLAQLRPEAETLYPLAILCLQPAALQHLLVSQRADRLLLLLKMLLNQGGAYQGAEPYHAYSRVTGSRLAMAALGFLLNAGEGHHWLRDNSPAVSQLETWQDAIASGEIALEQILDLLTDHNLLNASITARWLRPLWQRKAVRSVVHRHAGREAVQKLDARLNQIPNPQRNAGNGKQGSDMPTSEVSNAGLVLLWPLLPRLFAHMELIEEGQFPGDASRWQAVQSLHYLAWGSDYPAVEIYPLNQLLCGIDPDVAMPDIIPLNEQQQQQIDAWLTGVGHQLPGWQKLALSDIRALFLQRPGEVVYNTDPPQIIVHEEAFDYLLADVPWPLTLVSLPWLEQPLTLIWPLPHLTG